MGTKIIGTKIIGLNETESTNAYARNIETNKLENGTIIISQFQTSGRGYNKNSWESEAGKNITCSIILLPEKIKAEDQYVISKFVSLAITDYLSIKGIVAKIKWPNDIYIGDKKIAGILIENSVKGEYIDKTIIGIGININQESFKSDAPNPISLKNITKSEYSISHELEELIRFLNHWYNQVVEDKNGMIDKDYKQKMYRIDELSVFSDNTKKFEGYIKGVNKFGQLMIETTEKEKLLFNFKEVAFLI